MPMSFVMYFESFALLTLIYMFLDISLMTRSHRLLDYCQRIT